jgi:hypothetical protein
MPDNQADKGNVIPAPATGLPTSIPLGQTTHLDLSWMPEDQRRALLTDYARNSLNLAAKATELGIEVNVLRGTLDTLATTTQDVSKNGDSVTITHVQNSKFGRTEVIMGNTEAANRGKLSKTQTGEFNWTPFYIIGGVIALIIIVSIIMRH